MVEEILMKPGRWDLKLKPDTPRSVLRDIDVRKFGFSMILITPVYIRPTAMTVQEIWDRAIYAGVYKEQNSNFMELAGPGAITLLGDESGHGPIYDSGIHEAAPGLGLRNWITTYVTDDNGIVLDASQPPTGGSQKPSDASAGDTKRDVLDYVCDIFDKEWRLDPDLTLYVDDRDNLFVTEPEVVLSQYVQGRESNFYGLYASSLVRDVDLIDYVTEVSIESDAGLGGEILLDIPYDTPDGAELDWEMWDSDSRAQTVANAETIATRLLNTYGTPAFRFHVTVRDQHVRNRIVPGDHLWVYDPLIGVVNHNNPRKFAGRIIYPSKIRLASMSWPITKGKGVYLRRHAEGTGGVVDLYDLTPWVEFESPEATLEVGYRWRKLPQRRTVRR